MKTGTFRMFHNSGFEEKHNTLFTLQKNNAMSDDTVSKSVSEIGQ